MWQTAMENPWALGLVGLCLSGLLGWVGVLSGRRSVWLATGLVILATAALVVASLRIETDREQIRRTIGEVAQAVASNDLERVLTYLHPAAAPGLQRARSELPLYVFHEARVTRMRSIEVNRRVQPAAAIAEFNVAVEVQAAGQRIPIRRLVRAYFVLQGGRWLVRDYEHFEPLAGLADN